MKLGLPERSVREQLGGLSYAELEEFCSDIQRQLILASPGAKSSMIARSVLAQWKTRGAVRR